MELFGWGKRCHLKSFDFGAAMPSEVIICCRGTSRSFRQCVLRSAFKMHAGGKWRQMVSSWNQKPVKNCSSLVFQCSTIPNRGNSRKVVSPVKEGLFFSTTHLVRRALLIDSVHYAFPGSDRRVEVSLLLTMHVVTSFFASHVFTMLHMSLLQNGK